MGDEDAPRRAPLDTGFRRYDGGGGGALASTAGVGRGYRSRESPLRRGVGVGSAKGIGDGGALPMPLWVPVFTGTTMGGVVVGEGWWWWRAPFVEGLRQAQGADSGCGATGCWRGWGRDGGWFWGAAMLLDFCLRWKSSGERWRDGAFRLVAVEVALVVWADVLFRGG